MFNRVIKGKLPVINSKKIVNRHKEARDNEKTRQQRNREYANQRKNTRKSDLQVGDYVLVRQEKKHKLTANVNHKPYKVINKPQEEDTDDEGLDYEENSIIRHQPSISNENNVVPRRSNRIRRLPNRYGHEYPSVLIN